ncbi:MAG TPA: hypothetical protein VML55_05280 [Planctomycetaceae bacterium]|nr:hypothetical protein [Planctomycetaceae bacterium]
MEKHPWLAPVAGAVVFLIGLVLVRSNRNTWQRLKNDAALDHADRVHYHARYRRRMQMALMLMLLGLMIPLSDPGKDAAIRLVQWEKVPWLMPWFLGLELLLVLWVILLALADMLSTTTHSRAALSRVREKQRELRDQLAELKRRRSNGHAGPRDE